MAAGLPLVTVARDHAAFVRNNQTPSMEPLRAALVGVGLEEVGSFGASGNFVFHACGTDAERLERRISAALGADVFVRDQEELSAIVAHDPYSGRQGAGLFLAASPVDKTRAVFRNARGPGDEPPVAFGATVYFVSPTRLPGRRSLVDFERELGVSGTMRSSTVVIMPMGTGSEMDVSADLATAGSTLGFEGGQVRMTEPSSTQGPIIYLSAKGDIDGMLERAVQAGGKIRAPKQDFGQMGGWLALVVDTEGNLIGLSQSSE